MAEPWISLVLETKINSMACTFYMIFEDEWQMLVIVILLPFTQIYLIIIELE